MYKLLRTQGHNVVAVFTIPDVQGRADPLAEAAEKDGVPVFKFPRWRAKGKPIPSVSAIWVKGCSTSIPQRLDSNCKKFHLEEFPV